MGSEVHRITLQGHPHRCERGRLGVHLELGGILDTYKEGVEARNFMGVHRAFISYLEVGTGLSKEEVEKLSFLESGEAFLRLQGLNRLRFYPPFLDREEPSDLESKMPPWDYKWRELHIWIHTMASTYGWSREEILRLMPEEAVIYIQEILLDRQFQHEWEYGLSGQGMIYNKRTRTSHFRPLVRPRWMVLKKPATVKLPKSLLPVGNVIYGANFEPQEVSKEGEFKS